MLVTPYHMCHCTATQLSKLVEDAGAGHGDQARINWRDFVSCSMHRRFYLKVRCVRALALDLGGCRAHPLVCDCNDSAKTSTLRSRRWIKTTVVSLKWTRLRRCGCVFVTLWPLVHGDATSACGGVWYCVVSWHLG